MKARTKPSLTQVEREDGCEDQGVAIVGAVLLAARALGGVSRA